MRYLGVEIITDEYFEFHTSAVTCGAYLGSDDIKKDIRKKVLPTYKPTKTLEFFQYKYGMPAKYNNITNCIEIGDGLMYDVKKQEFYAFCVISSGWMGTKCEIGEIV